MKFKGHKIGGVTYLVSDAEIEKAGSIEVAALKSKALIEAQKEADKTPLVEETKTKKVKKVSEQPEENLENV